MFRTLRALRFVTFHGEQVSERPDLVGPNVTWNVERGRELTADGLPVGLQLVGRGRGDWDLLAVAHGFEAATGHAAVMPALTGATPRESGPRRAGRLGSARGGSVQNERREDERGSRCAGADR